MTKAIALEQNGDPRASRTEQKDGVDSAMKEFLNPTDRFAARVKASLKKEGEEQDADLAAQQQMFVDGANVDLNKDESTRASQVHQHEQKKAGCCSNMTPYVLLMALSIHSLFEGLACGLAKDESSCLNMVIAIVVHKGAAALSLGISLVKTFPNDFTLIRWLIVIFSVATPIGVAIGIALGEAGDIYDIIFSSLAAGTFIYIGCNEVIVQEFSIEGLRWWKLLAFLFGISIIVGLFFIDND